MYDTITSFDSLSAYDEYKQHIGMNVNAASYTSDNSDGLKNPPHY